MALSKDQEKAASDRFEQALDEYMKKDVINSKEDNPENWCIVFGYKNTENLVKHSRTLTGLTMGLIVLGLGMISLAIVQLVLLL